MKLLTWLSQRSCWGVVVGSLWVAGAGCGPGPELAPVSGTVLYKGQPLEFGGVWFQPDVGEPARGAIQPDGSFQLSTYREGDGALIGVHKVRVTCFEGQRPARTADGEQELALGGSLIPERYTHLHTSGLEFEVRADRTEPYIIELTDR